MNFGLYFHFEAISKSENSDIPSLEQQVIKEIGILCNLLD